MNKFFLILLLIVVSPVSATEDNFTGKVVAILDGDTIEVLKEGKGVRIRLAGIDCPEKSQAYGQVAKQFTSELIYNKQATIKGTDIDRYGRIIADVYLPDGRWLNYELIKEGLAWHYKTYSDNQQLSEAEQKARQQKKHLWQDPNPVAPWDFRRHN